MTQDLVIEWVDSDNTATTLSPVSEMSGIHMPPVNLVTRENPTTAGGFLESSRDEIRPIRLRWLIHGYGGNASKVSQIDAFSKTLHHSKGVGKLRFTQDSVVREIECWYRGGLEDLKENRPDVSAASLMFTAVRPYWRAATYTQQSFELGESVGAFLGDPFFPLRISGGDIFANPTITNVGPVEAWPIWTITGPGSNPTFINQTSGLRLEITYDLDAGEQIVIDTSEGVKTIESGMGTNLTQFLSDDSDLWPLLSGGNAVQLQLTDAVENESAVNVQWLTQHLSPYDVT